MNSKFCVSPKVTDLPYIAQSYVIVKYCIVLQRLMLAYISYSNALFLHGPLCFGLMAHLSVKRLPVHPYMPSFSRSSFVITYAVSVALLIR